MREKDIKNREKYQFTRNWFLNRNLDTFRNFVLPTWENKPITYLEIGVFEGMSLTWMLQYVLTHPDARAVGIDPWLVTTKLSGDIMEQVMSRALYNVSTAGKAWASLPGIEHVVYKGSLVRGNSAEVLRIMNSRGLLGISRNSVDLCMIDGNHNDYAAYDDAEQCLPLVKPGGWLLFDDVENQVTKKRHVKQGLEMFVKDYRDKVNFIWKDRYMECFEVL